jgi:hypothetical protein
LARKERAQRAKVQREKERKRRKRKHVKGCRSEFDYPGWDRYGVWRREVMLLRAERR